MGRHRVATRSEMGPYMSGSRSRIVERSMTLPFGNVAGAKMTLEEVGDEAVVADDPDGAVYIGRTIQLRGDRAFAAQNDLYQIAVRAKPLARFGAWI